MDKRNRYSLTQKTPVSSRLQPKADCLWSSKNTWYFWICSSATITLLACCEQASNIVIWTGSQFDLRQTLAKFYISKFTDSSITLIHGVEKANSPLAIWLCRRFCSRLQVLPYTENAAMLYGSMRAALECIGRLVGFMIYRLQSMRVVMGWFWVAIICGSLSWFWGWWWRIGWFELMCRYCDGFFVCRSANRH